MMNVLEGIHPSPLHLYALRLSGTPERQMVESVVEALKQRDPLAYLLVLPFTYRLESLDAEVIRNMISACERALSDRGLPVRGNLFVVGA